jgi:hypothetical protein
MWATDIAEKRPISCNFGKGGLLKPIRGLVLHVTNGTGRTPYNWFCNSKAKASSHFGNPKHGRLEQYVDTDDAAWAQGRGNYHWLSVENTGLIGESLTPSQVANLARLMRWLHDEEGIPFALADNPAGHGLGYHSMGGKHWGHQYCPGTPVIAQRQLILWFAEYRETTSG